MDGASRDMGRPTGRSGSMEILPCMAVQLASTNGVPLNLYGTSGSLTGMDTHICQGPLGICSMPARPCMPLF